MYNDTVSHASHKVYAEDHKNKSNEISSDLSEINDDEIIFLVELIDQGYHQFILNLNECNYEDKAFTSILNIFNKGKIKTLINSLVEKKYLITEYFQNNTVLCPNCYSEKVKVIIKCPQCGSNNLSKQEILYHDYCKFGGEKKAFLKNGNLICPKCKSDLKKIYNGSIDEENNSEYYRIKGALYKCNDCKSEVDISKVDFVCLECGLQYNHINAQFQESIRYTIPDEIFNKVLNRDKVNLLIVEDFSPQADVEAMILQNSSSNVEYDITIVENGKSAIIALEETEFDIILLDLGLPDIEGLELLKKMKKQWPSIPVIVITGYDDVEVAVQAMKIGAIEYLLKKGNMTETLPEILEKIIRTIKDDKLITQPTNNATY